MQNNSNKHEILLTAYMNLFDALVMTFQSKKMSLGASLARALCEIRKIVVELHKSDSNESTKYLKDLYNTHNDATFKKMMKPENIDKVDIPQESTEALNTKAQKAQAELQRAIESIENIHIHTTQKPINTVPATNLVALFAHNSNVRRAA